MQVTMIEGTWQVLDAACKAIGHLALGDELKGGARSPRPEGFCQGAAIKLIMPAGTQIGPLAVASW
jgi:hypothetical protein